MISYGVAGMVIALSKRGVKLFECGVVHVCINEGLFECRDGNGDYVLTERRSDMVIWFKICDERESRESVSDDIKSSWMKLRSIGVWLDGHEPSDDAVGCGCG